jgi:ribonuclease G
MFSVSVCRSNLKRGGQKEHRMSKEIYISSTPHETRLAIVENDAPTEIYYERENEYTLAGSIYNGKVTRVLPGMQSSFVDIGLERDAFLYITDFMEEAGDSADFETNGNGDSRRRNGSAPTIEGSLASDPSTDSGNRSDRGDRNGRGDRGRGRGRRDRGGNRDRQPLSDTPAPLDSQDLQDTQDAQNFNRDDFNRPTEFSSDNAPLARTDEADLGGEGAPGADGGRRWRGRRGRRRGRGPGQRDESPQIAGAPSGASSSETSSEVSYGDDSFDIDGAAAPTSTAAPIDAEPSTQPTSYSQESSNRNDRGDRDRGDRDRNNRGRRDRNDRNDRNRGNRSDRGGRDSRAPRGFAPRTSLYGVDDASAYNESTESAGEPIVLPGESLSKYRKDSDTPTAAAPKPTETNIIIPSAPEFTIPAGWDGGDTLPGESLSRHRRQENLPVRSPENFQERFPDRRSPYRQDIRTDHHTNPEPGTQAIQESNRVNATEVIEKQPEVMTASTPELISQKPSTPSIPVEYEPVVEYEPIDASASYRVDPAAPIEFRQSAPVLDTPEVEEAPEIIEEVRDSSSTHSVTPGPGEPVAQLPSDLTPEPIPAIPERFDWQTGPAPTPVITAETAPH